MYIYDGISLNYSQSEKYFKQICREDQNTFYIEWSISENRTVFKMMWENKVETGRL